MKQIYIRDKQEVRAAFCLYNAHSEVPKLEVAFEGEKTSFGEQTKALPAHSLANDLVLWFAF